MWPASLAGGPHQQQRTRRMKGNILPSPPSLVPSKVLSAAAFTVLVGYSVSDVAVDRLFVFCTRLNLRVLPGVKCRSVYINQGVFPQGKG